jgi:hypothetical protein
MINQLILIKVRARVKKEVNQTKPKFSFFVLILLITLLGYVRLGRNHKFKCHTVVTEPDRLHDFFPASEQSHIHL